MSAFNIQALLTGISEASSNSAEASDGPAPVAFESLLAAAEDPHAGLPGLLVPNISSLPNPDTTPAGTTVQQELGPAVTEAPESAAQLFNSDVTAGGIAPLNVHRETKVAFESGANVDPVTGSPIPNAINAQSPSLSIDQPLATPNASQQLDATAEHTAELRLDRMGDSGTDRQGSKIQSAPPVSIVGQKADRHQAEETDVSDGSVPRVLIETVNDNAVDSVLPHQTIVNESAAVIQEANDSLDQASSQRPVEASPGLAVNQQLPAGAVAPTEVLKASLQQPELQKTAEVSNLPNAGTVENRTNYSVTPSPVETSNNPATHTYLTTEATPVVSQEASTAAGASEVPPHNLAASQPGESQSADPEAADDRPLETSEAATESSTTSLTDSSAEGFLADQGPDQQPQANSSPVVDSRFPESFSTAHAETSQPARVASPSNNGVQVHTGSETSSLTGSQSTGDLKPADVAGQVVSAVRDVVEYTDGSSSKTVSLDLQPAELGRLRIHIEQTPDAIAAQIFATDMVSSDLLSHQKDSLLEALSELGFDSTSVDISHDRREQSQPENESGTKQFLQFAASNDTERDLVDRRLRASDGLNIVV